MGYIEEVQEDVRDAMEAEGRKRFAATKSSEIAMSHFFFALTRGNDPYTVTAETTFRIPKENPEYELYRMITIIAGYYDTYCGREMLLEHLAHLTAHYTPSAQTDEPPL